MTDYFNIFKTCTHCGGDGKLIVNNDSNYDPGPPQEINCPLCNGEGRILWGEIDPRDID